MTVKALLFDLDGVLVDAMAWHEEAFLTALRMHGNITLTSLEHRERYAGLSTKQKLAALERVGLISPKQVSEIAQEKQRLTGHLIEQRTVVDRQRVYLLEHFAAAGFTLGCVTNCIKSTATELLRRTELLPFMACLVTNEDVTSPKPAPEPYYKACSLLGLQPEETLVFEDHDLGLTSAFNAGCWTTQILEYRELTVERVWTAIQQANAAIKAKDQPE